MRTRLYVGLGAFAAIAAVIALANQGVRDAIAQEIDQPVIDQQQTDQLQTTETREYGRQDTALDRSQHVKGHKASELIGLNVRGRSGDDNIGSINDLMIGHDGRVVYAAVSFGGFLGLGDKLFAVPFDAIEIVKTEDELYARMDVTEETLKNMEGFDQDNWPTKANRSFVGQPEHRQADRPDTDVDVDVTR
jgi:hypothetical protein